MPNDQTNLVWTVSHRLLDSVILPSSAAYVAGPLETGRIYYEARAGQLTEPIDVKRFNGLQMSQFARRLRSELAYPVIDPGLLEIEGWVGSDYLEFFIGILCRYAREVWLIDGWQYSTGATAEYRAALEAGIPCLSADGRPMPRGAARTLISEAAEHVASMGLDARSLLRNAA